MPEDRRLYGTVMGPTGKKNYNIQLDLLPSDHNIFPVPRAHITVIRKGDEEPDFTHQQRDDAEVAEQCENLDNASGDEGGGKRNYRKESIDAFLSLTKEEQKASRAFCHRYGPAQEECVNWDILADDEQILEDPMTHPEDGNPFSIDVPWDPNPDKVDYNSVFFDHFFPDLEGKAELLDEYLADDRCSIHHTVKSDKIKFHRETDDDDPDILVSVTLFMLLNIINSSNTFDITVEVVCYCNDCRGTGSTQRC